MSQRSLGHRAPLLWLTVPLMLGLALGPEVESSQVGWLLTVSAVLAGVGVAAAWRGAPWLWGAALVGSMGLAGAANGALHRPPRDRWPDRPAREARLTLRVDRVFPQAFPWKAAGLATIVAADPLLGDLVGHTLHYALASQSGRGAPDRGAVVTATGILGAVPRDAPAGSFEAFLTGAGIGFRLSRGRILTEEKPPSAYRNFCSCTLDRLSRLLGAGLESKRPELVAIARAMLLGQQQELSPAQSALFRQTGTLHVFSISGLHIGVISIGLNALLALLRLPRWPALALELGALWLYVDLTGAAPSAIRAWVMVASFRSARTFHFSGNPVAALTASALVVMLVSPLDLFSASFQMSYGILAALLLLGLPLSDCWQAKLPLFRDLPQVSWTWHQRLRSYVWRKLLSALGVGVASALVSAVTGAEFFQLFTPGALVANLWVIPLSSLVILIGLVSMFTGLAGFAAGSNLANHASASVLWFVDHALAFSARLPGATFGATFRLPGTGAWALVAVLVAMAFGYSRNWQGVCRGFWPPFAVVAVVMALGVKFS